MLHHIALSAILLMASFVAYGQDSAVPAASSAASIAESGEGELYVFNDSGWTLIPSDQVVTDNEKELARLPRQTFVKLPLSLGQHVLKPDPPLWKQEVRLMVEPGHHYYVVIAYKPERSWLMPFAGTPLVLREVSEEQGLQLLRELKPK